MKRIILSLGVLILITQNVFARSDAEYDKMIANEKDITWKQVYRCNKIRNKPHTANINICLKALTMLTKNYPNTDSSATLLNIGYIYDETGDDLNGYKYYMKAAKSGGNSNIQAQKNLNIMCKESPWACK